MSRLEGISKPYRDQELAKNRYSLNDEYNVGNPDALSTGDELGKGEYNGNVGSATDIKTREQLLAKNKYNSNAEYYAGTA
jgi:hypothetical protein